MRQGLIRTLRILVPAIFLPTLLSTVAVTVVDGAGRRPGGPLRRPPRPARPGAPSRSAARCRSTRRPFEWDPAAPPANWRALVDRWEGLNSVRAWLAVGAFALLLAATALCTMRA